MIKCKKCGKEFDDLKETEVAMGAVKCPKCGAILDQEGNVLKEEKNMFFSNLIKVRRPYINSRGAVASHTPAKADKDLAWDGEVAVIELQKWASSDGTGDKSKIQWSKYRLGFAWYDSNKPEDLGSYKLPHHIIENSSLKTVWKGVVAAMAALNGARGGVDIPDEDRKAVYNHLKVHYEQFDEKAPDLKE